MKWVNTEDGFWVTGALRDDGARRGRVLEPLWLNGYHIIARVQSKLQRPLCCFNDGALITNYTAQQCPSPHSSALTFINILLVSLGARHFIPPPRKKSLLLLLFRSLIFIVTKPALFWAQTLLGKLILVDHCHQGCHGYSHTR